MQVHFPTAAPRRDGDFAVSLNPGNDDGPFAIVDLSHDGGLRIFIESPEEADRLIRAGVEAKRLLAIAADPCGGCGHAKGSHWERAEPGGPRTGCGYLGCTCTRYEGPAAMLAQSIAAGTPVMTWDEDMTCGLCDQPMAAHQATPGGYACPDPSDELTAQVPA